VLGIDEKNLKLSRSVLDEQSGKANDRTFVVGRQDHPALTDPVLGEDQPLGVLQRGASIVFVRQRRYAKHAFKVLVIGKCGLTQAVRHCVSVTRIPAVVPDGGAPLTPDQGH
jgi:hypothetical protein